MSGGMVEARRLAAQLAPEASDPCIGHYGTHGDHEDEGWLALGEGCPLLDLFTMLDGPQ